MAGILLLICFVWSGLRALADEAHEDIEEIHRTCELSDAEITFDKSLDKSLSETPLNGDTNHKHTGERTRLFWMDRKEKFRATIFHVIFISNVPLNARIITTILGVIIFFKSCPGSPVCYLSIHNKDKLLFVA